MIRGSSRSGVAEATHRGTQCSTSDRPRSEQDGRPVTAACLRAVVESIGLEKSVVHARLANQRKDEGGISWPSSLVLGLKRTRRTGYHRDPVWPTSRPVLSCPSVKKSSPIWRESEGKAVGVDLALSDLSGEIRAANPTLSDTETHPTSLHLAGSSSCALKIRRVTL